MVRPASFDSNGMKKGVWSKEEDDKLRDFIERYGHSNWRLLPMFAGLARCGKSCRLRWVNYLKPGLKRGNFSKQERDLIIKLHAQLGNKWSTIAPNLPGRTDNEVKNYWNAHIQKRSKRNKGGISKVIKTRTPKEKPSSSELINFSNIIAANQTETPLNNVYDQQGLSVQNLENNINTVDSAAQADRGNIVVTEEYYQTCYELPPFAEEAELDNIWLCQEMRNNNMSIFSESSDDGFSAIESQLRDFWAEPLGEEAISWYFGDIMDTLQD